MAQGYPYSTGQATVDQVAVQTNAFMRRVYNWMAGGLALSGLVAWWVVSSPATLGMFLRYDPATGTTSPTMLYWASLIGVFALVMFLSAGIQRIRVGTATTLFLLYAGLNGVFLAPLLLMYTSASVFKAFIITAGTFGVTSIWATTTKKDLSSWGSFLFMGLVGIIIASVVNMFLGSPMVDWIISWIGVGVFVGLTAYDTQAIRAMYLQAANEVTVSKMAIFGALKLYLDFLNLFLMLLRLFGERR